MRLRELRLHNFRAFRGDQGLSLETQSSRPAVLVVGMNGSGKTTLLSAFGWVLYGTFTGDVEQQERIVNDSTWKEAPEGARVEARVELEFEHEGSIFTARRIVEQVKMGGSQGPGRNQLILTERTPEGATHQVENGQDRIDKIMPPGLRPFFFFNGERMAEIGAEGNSGDVRDAIRTLLGVEQLERARHHLSQARRKLVKESGDLGGAEWESLSKAVEAAEERVEQLERDRARLDGEANHFTNELSAVDQKMRLHQEAAPFQERKEQLTSRRDQARETRERKEKERNRRIGQEGHLAFMSGLTIQFAALAENLRERGELPTPIKRDFIDHLLTESRCICGTDLTDGSPQLARILEWKTRSGLRDVEARWQSRSGQASMVEEVTDQLRVALGDLTKEIADADADIRSLDAQLSELERDLEDIPLEEVRQLTERRRQLDASRTKKIEDRAAVEAQLLLAKREVESSRRKFDSAEARTARAQMARRRIEVVQEVENALALVQEIRNDAVRRALDSKVREVFSRISVKPAVPEVGTDFELRLLSADQQAIKSTGENQILALSFVGAVSELARSIRVAKARDDSFGDGGGEYPIVMDAPFGNLDILYQDEVANALPGLTSQIVALLSQSQLRGAVLTHLRSAASRIYVIHTVTTKEGSAESDFVLDGRSYPYVSRGDADSSTIVEVPL